MTAEYNAASTADALRQGVYDKSNTQLRTIVSYIQIHKYTTTHTSKNGKM